MTRKKLFAEVEQIITHYCEGCFLYQHLKSEQGRRRAHRFCITECTVGETLKVYGRKLSKVK